MKTAPANKKIREIITMVQDGSLIPKPEFQRRLVWTNKDKDHFIDTILKGYPFPEIYLANGDVDLETGQGTQLLVDGLQRVNTMIEYFTASPNLKLQTVSPYSELTDSEKEAFLLYDVAVRDLGAAHRDEIVEVFRRINATKYGLRDIEINNAVYGGRFKQFCEELAEHSFFLGNEVFSTSDLKRMGDLRYTLGVVITLLGGYFNRDDLFAEFLGRYNDDFPDEGKVTDRLTRCFDLIEECGFGRTSRVWKKADLFTLLVELDLLLQSEEDVPQPSDLLGILVPFFDGVDQGDLGQEGVTGIYYKAALQASNDRVNRLRRAHVVGGLLRRVEHDEIMTKLKAEGLA